MFTKDKKRENIESQEPVGGDYRETRRTQAYETGEIESGWYSSVVKGEGDQEVFRIYDDSESYIKEAGGNDANAVQWNVEDD